MRREDVLAVLKAHEAELRARGVARVARFGSLARGEARPDSDVGLRVEIDPAAGLDLGSYTGVVLFLQDLFDVSVDVANRQALNEHVRPSAERDAIYAFERLQFGRQLDRLHVPVTFDRWLKPRR